MTINRRDVLAHGGKGIAAAVMLPFLPAIADTKEDKEDAELFRLYEKYKRLEQLEIEASDRLDRARLPVLRSFPKAPKERFWEERWNPSLAFNEASKRAGVPALKKKHEAAVNATKDVLSRLYDIRANTAEGMLLKIVVERTYTARHSWRELRPAGVVGYHPPRSDERFYITSSSVEMDIERLLSGRRI